MLETQELKLKQASAVLGVPPKELQNLVQFKVLRPRKRARIVYYDLNVLYVARVALYLRSTLGTSTDRLAALTRPLIQLLRSKDASTIQWITFISRPSTNAIPIEVRVPFRELAKGVNEQVKQLYLFPDLPRGRKRPGWKQEFCAAWKDAAQDMSGTPPTEQLLARIRSYRREKKLKPEVTIVEESKAAGT